MAFCSFQMLVLRAWRPVSAICLHGRSPRLSRDFRTSQKSVHLDNLVHCIQCGHPAHPLGHGKDSDQGEAHLGRTATQMWRNNRRRVDERGEDLVHRL